MKHWLLLEIVYRICLLLLVVYLILMAQTMLAKIITDSEKITYIHDEFIKFDLECIEE